jgi:inner membrane protein YhjD
VTQTSSNRIDTVTASVDRLQQQHHALSFVCAVIKKYNDDSAGQRAALLTYYGFLALFPLLLVATSIADFIAEHNAHVRIRLLNGVTSYFPVGGSELQQNIHSGNRTGLALIVGLLFALYGARGIANALRNTLDSAWGTPRSKRSAFPTSTLKNLALMFGAGLGLLITTALSSYATAALGRSFIFRLVPIAISGVLLYLLCMYIFLIGPAQRRPRRDLRIGAVTVVVGLLILQTIGGYLITHQLHNTSGLYGQFALVLAILSWLYLLAQVFTYAVEVNVVHAYRLWPRSLSGAHPTVADEKTKQLYAEE